MTKLPRILPLAAIAAGGVLAINALENGPGIFGAARSFAEAVAPKSGPAAKRASPLPADASPSGATAAPPGQVVAARPAPICAESPAQLAKDAGLSPAELQVIQSLGARRGELDAREQGLDTQLALIQAAETKVDAKIATMNGLKADMQILLGQLDDKQQAEVDRLVKVYEGMKPQDSAARFVLLSDDVRLPIAAKMKERALSAMIAKMPPADAKRLTESLAARYVAQAAAARAAIAPPAPPAQAAAAPPAISPAKPTRVAAANPSPAPGAPAAEAAKPIHRKPHKAKPAAAGLAAAPGAGQNAPAKPPQTTAQAAPTAAKTPPAATPPPGPASAPAAPAMPAKTG